MSQERQRGLWVPLPQALTKAQGGAPLTAELHPGCALAAASMLRAAALGRRELGSPRLRPRVMQGHLGKDPGRRVGWDRGFPSSSATVKSPKPKRFHPFSVRCVFLCLSSHVV